MSIQRLAGLISFLLGLVFIFVWAPHPWGWYGIDQYHQFAIELAQGREFATLDVPWGYAYFLAAFYRVFGPTPLPALLAQNLLNALIPAIVYAYAAKAFDRRVAAVACGLVAVLSFNTIYVSTESTDSISTFLFMLMVWTFVRARDGHRLGLFAVVGVLLGVMAQFRPNLILLPFALLALNWLLGPRGWQRIREGAVVILFAAIMLSPWTIRNYRLTGQFMPTSTHGGIQLWYGTLQTGPYLQSRAHNPRSVFSTPAFDYTSLTDVPVLFEAWMNCGPGTPQAVDVLYRIDNGTYSRLALAPTGGNIYSGSIPALHRNARIYYYVEVRWPSTVKTTPVDGAADPLVYFVNADHLGDLDVDDRLLDLFDAVRTLRHIAWQEPLRAADQLDRNHDGRVDEADFRENLRIVLRPSIRGEVTADPLRDVVATSTDVRARFVDGTMLVVPKQWNGLVTDLELGDGLAASLLGMRHRFSQPYPEPPVPLAVQCLGPGELSINTPFYRVLPHETRRYLALAFDNIRRDPAAYGWSVAYRAVRLFVVQGTDDRQTAQQFNRSRLVYFAATLVSALYLGLFVVGAWIAWRRGYAVWLPLALIAYVPATIAFVLTNMRYTITVQPLLLIFVAVAVEAAWRRVVKSAGRE